MDHRAAACSGHRISPVDGDLRCRIHEHLSRVGNQPIHRRHPAQDAFDEVNQRFTPPFEETNRALDSFSQGSNVLTKTKLLAMLEAQQRLKERERFRVVSTSSVARIVAQTLDPSATTLDAQIRTLEGATSTAIERAIRTAIRLRIH